MLRRFSAHKMLGLYSVINAGLCFLIFLKLGWLSVVCVFLCYFFMSITFPTIFALGIFGLGARAKAASAYIVMGIVGGALLPKLMGAIADHYNMSRGFIVPLICFVFIALYGYGWPKLSRAESLHGVGASGGALSRTHTCDVAASLTERRVLPRLWTELAQGRSYPCQKDSGRSAETPLSQAGNGREWAFHGGAKAVFGCQAYAIQEPPSHLCSHPWPDSRLRLGAGSAAGTDLR